MGSGLVVGGALQPGLRAHNTQRNLIIEKHVEIKILCWIFGVDLLE